MLEPLGDRVILKVEEEKEQTVGGFVLAGTNKEGTQIATVVAIGDDAHILTDELIAPDVAAGDKIVIENGVGIEVKDNDGTMAIIHGTDILAILT